MPMARRRKKKRKPPARVSKLRKLALVTRAPPRPEYRRVLSIALALPGVEECTAYGTPGLRVKGKILARLRAEAEGARARRCDFIDSEILLKAAPRPFFVTDNYRNNTMVLGRLNKVRLRELPALIERAWRTVAPPKLVAEYDARRANAAK
jgi:hypothetical protein